MSDFSDLEFVETEAAPVLAAQMSGACAPDPAAIYTAYGADGIKFILAMPIASPPAKATPEGSACFVDTLWRAARSCASRTTDPMRS